MIGFPHILADGFPAPLIFGAIAVVFWLLTTIAKSQQKPPGAENTPGRATEARRLEEIRERMRRQGDPRAENFRNAPPPLPKQANRKGKGRNKSRAAPVVTISRPAAAPTPPTPASSAHSPEPYTQATPAPAHAVTKNVRLLLQRGAAREAFVLAEILGKPKSMQ